MPVIRTVFAGRAVILLFHEIHRDCRSELMTGISPSLLEYSVVWLRREGWEILSLDQCLQRLSNGEKSGRYAVITFDDGYRDNVSTALPILERHDAPFTIYVPSGAPARTLQAWWLALRELFRSQDTVLIDAMATRFQCPDYQAKVLGLLCVTDWVHEDYRRIDLLIPTFLSAGLSFAALNDAYFVDDRTIQALARHPLVSIGGHTTSHPALKLLDAQSALDEITDNRSYLENLLQFPIRHFAYPYGDAAACGPREEDLARRAGFATAATTRHGQLGDPPLNLFALPRIGVYPSDTKVSFQARASGLGEAVRMLFGKRDAARPEKEFGVVA